MNKEEIINCGCYPKDGTSCQYMIKCPCLCHTEDLLNSVKLPEIETPLHKKQLFNYLINRFFN